MDTGYSILDTGNWIKYGMKGYGIISVEAFSDFDPFFAYVFVDGKNINLELVRQGLNRQKDRQKKSLLLDFIINLYFNTDKLKKYKLTKKSAKCFIQFIK
jgi:endonuclease YncB( thermonuclease family)